MADQQNPQQQQVQLRIDETRMRTTYANTIRTSVTPEEVVLDFGLNLPTPTPDNRPMLVFDVGSRVVLNWRGAKRLAASLIQVVNQHEAQFGQIDMNNPTPTNPPNAGGQGGGGGQARS